MPKLYEYLGMIFFFWANEHMPIHIHVSKGEFETIFVLIYEDGKVTELKKRKKRGVDLLPKAQEKEAEKLIIHEADNIIEKWTDYFIRNKAIECTKINKKL